MTKLVEKLKDIYGDSVITTADEARPSHNYEWYTDEIGHSIGIDYSVLTKKEIQLLNIFLPALRKDSTPSQLWKAFIEKGEMDGLDSLKAFVQQSEAHLLYFSFAKLPDDMTVFEETLTAYLDAPCTFISYGGHEGYAVVQGRPQNNYREFIDIAAADLFVAVKMLSSPSVPLAELPRLFHAITFSLHKALQQFPTRRFFQYHDLLMLGTLASLKEEDHLLLFGPLKHIMAEIDEETVTTLRAFFDHNLNVTNASKALFIHRNSLQYRLEKISERLGLDPKSFHDAALIQLIIEEKKYRSL